MQGNVVAKMCSGIDDSDVIVVFVSQNYIERVAGRAGPQDHCKKEFEYAVPPLRGPHWPARR